MKLLKKCLTKWNSFSSATKLRTVFLVVLLLGFLVFALQSVLQFQKNLSHAVEIEQGLFYPDSSSFLHFLAFALFDNPLFFQDRNDIFMDFFSINNMVSTNSPYIIGDSSYPPFVLMVAKIFAAFADFSKGAALARYSLGGMLSVSVFYLVCLTASLVLLIIAFRRHKLPVWTAVLVFFSLACSSPFLFLFDRGNYSLLTVPFVGFFFLYYRSEGKVLRELSYLSLAVAAAIKIYPAAFALILLSERRIAALVRTASYTVLFLILPFLAFEGGLDNVSAFLFWLSDFSGAEEGIDFSTTVYGISYSYALYNLVSIFSVLFHVDIEANGKVLELLSKFLVLLSIAAVLLVGLTAKRRWKIALASALATLFVPNISFVYSAVMLAVPVVLFFLEEERQKFDWGYLALILFVFLPKSWGYLFGYNTYAFRYGTTVANFTELLALVALLVLLTIESCKIFFPWLKTKYKILRNKAESRKKEKLT